jgi:hypothetical protein
MSSDVPIWQFRAPVDSARARTLLSYPNFNAVASLFEQATVECFLWEPFSGPTLRGCHRASFLLRVPEAAYDAFFNAPAGYRGEFAASAAAGDTANRKLLMQFEARLLAYTENRSQVTQSVIRDSLRASQAKLWIFEAEVAAQLGNTAPAITYAPWDQASESGVGLLAPIGTLLEVKGGWLAQNGEERLNPGKSGRSEDIHRTGFS